MKRITRHFLQGFIITAPIAFTLYVCYRLFDWIDKPLRTVFLDRFGHHIPGLGFVITVFLIGCILVLVGFLSSNLAARGILELLDHQFSRFPMIKILHSSVKDFVNAFVGDKKRFDEPALVAPIPGSTMRMVGFVTRKSLEMWGMEEKVVVYLPMAFNFGGNLIIISRTQVEPLDYPSADVMAFVVSGGISGKAKEIAVALPPNETA